MLSPAARLALITVLSLVLPATVRGSEEGPRSDSRRFHFVYEVEIGPFPSGAGSVDLFVPLPLENEQQRVLAYSVRSDVEGTVRTEPRYGNRFWHARLRRTPSKSIAVTLEVDVERRASHRALPASAGPLREEERSEQALFLQANERVVVGHEILAPILEEVRARAGSEDRAAVSRAIYDWVVENVEYKKVGTGWGNGDTFWACIERYGNCTDFHSLFISLARTEGIPARFEMGFPVPLSRAEGKVGGYHCWVEFYLPGAGWFPLDASEAFKHPERRDLLYGTQSVDRIHFTTGRDLRLGEGHRDRPLNYFVYPYVEVDGARWDGPIQQQFRYADIVDDVDYQDAGH